MNPQLKNTDLKG